MFPASLPRALRFALTSFLGLSLHGAIAWPANAQPPEPIAPPPVEITEDGEDVEMLTRGALHEAFADQVSQDLVAGVLAPVAPPAAIDELPPEIKPEGDDVEWIPGYWYWDDERDDYIWISGVWRNPPPGRRWIPGYWTELDGKYRRVSGMWSGSDVGDFEYLPDPPESLEAGPVSPAPSDDYFWVPGCWVYLNHGYSWRPGYWNRFRDDWVWMPTRYVWSPSGCLYQSGYWDYPFASRGQLYCPLYFHHHAYRQTHYRYRPSLTISTSSIFLHLFVRSGHSHYYFGNYYGNQHRHHYHPWYEFNHVGRRYDPLIAHAKGRSHHAGVDYVRRMKDWNHYFTRHENHRPPTTIRHQRTFEREHQGFSQIKHVALGRNTKQSLHDANFHGKFQRTSAAQHDQLRQRLNQMRSLTDTRQRQEQAGTTRNGNRHATTSQRGAGTAHRPGDRDVASHRNQGGAAAESHNGPRRGVSAQRESGRQGSDSTGGERTQGRTPETGGGAARGNGGRAEANRTADPDDDAPRSRPTPTDRRGRASVNGSETTRTPPRKPIRSTQNKSAEEAARATIDRLRRAAQSGGPASARPAIQQATPEAPRQSPSASRNSPTKKSGATPTRPATPAKPTLQAKPKESAGQATPGTRPATPSGPRNRPATSSSSVTPKPTSPSLERFREQFQSRLRTNAALVQPKPRTEPKPQPSPRPSTPVGPTRPKPAAAAPRTPTAGRQPSRPASNGSPQAATTQSPSWNRSRGNSSSPSPSLFSRRGPTSSTSGSATPRTRPATSQPRAATPQPRSAAPRSRPSFAPTRTGPTARAPAAVGPQRGNSFRSSRGGRKPEADKP